MVHVCTVVENNQLVALCYDIRSNNYIVYYVVLNGNTFLVDSLTWKPIGNMKWLFHL